METFNGQTVADLMLSHEEIRKRVSINLHEGVSQTLYTIHMGIQHLEAQSEQTLVKKMAKELSLLCSQTIEDLRLQSAELYPLTLERFGFYPAFCSYLKIYSSTFGILVDNEENGEIHTLSPSVSLGIFRVCQEILMEAAKCTDACRIKIIVNWGLTDLTIRIEEVENSQFIQRNGHSKIFTILQGMKARSALFGGTLTIESGKDSNFVVDLTVPIHKMERGAVQ